MLKFERGLADYLASLAEGRPTVTEEMFTDRIEQVRAIEDVTDAELIADIREDCEALGIDPEPIIAGYFGTDAAQAGAPRGETTH